MNLLLFPPLTAEKTGVEDIKSVATLIKTIPCPFYNGYPPDLVANDIFIGYKAEGEWRWRDGEIGLYEKRVLYDEKDTADALVRKIQCGLIDNTSLFYIHEDRRTGADILLKKDFWKVQGGDDEEYYEDAEDSPDKDSEDSSDEDSEDISGSEDDEESSSSETG